MQIYQRSLLFVYLALFAITPAWAQDGLLNDKIVYEDVENRIIIYDPTTYQEMVLLDDGHYNASPDLSPDGTQIVFVSDRDGDQELYMMDVDGTNLRQLTHNSTRDSWPIWSPDGTQIAYLSSSEDNVDLMVINIDGSSTHNLTQGVGNNREPSWSPDGQKLAFIFYQAKTEENPRKYQVSVIDADGHNWIQLTDDNEVYNDPVWSQDGSKIAVSTGENFYSMNVNGTELTQITHETGDIGYFTWLSNDAIVFEKPQPGVPYYRINLDGSERQLIHLGLPGLIEGVNLNRVITPLQDEAIISFTLIDADTEEDVSFLYNGTTITQPNITIRANTEPPIVGSVVFGLDDEPRFKVENEPAYALKGDDNGDYHAWLAEPGTYTLTATPYTEADGGGEAGTPLTITFTVEAPGS